MYENAFSYIAGNSLITQKEDKYYEE